MTDSTANESSLQILKLDPEAKLPKRQTDGSVGYDLYSLRYFKFNGLRALVSTGIAIKLPPGTIGLIKSRSELSFKYGIEVGAGVIDFDFFPGHVQILLYNHSNRIVNFKKHSFIAQLFVIPILTPKVIEVTKEECTGRCRYKKE